MILIADNFQYQGRKSLDSRIICETISDMVSMAESIIYDGILVYNKETEKFYVFKSTNTIDSVLGKWREFESGSNNIKQYCYATMDANNVTSWDSNISISDSLITGVNGNTSDAIIIYILENNSIFGIGFINNYDKANKEFNINCHKLEKDTDTHSVEYKQNEIYLKGNLIILNGKLYIALNNFISNSTEPTVEDSLIYDIINRNLNSVYIDTDTNCKEYQQGFQYKTTDLIKRDNKLYLISADFTSDTTGFNTDDSFQLDLQSNKIIPVNGEANAQVLPYTQATNYKKDSLIYLDKSIARAEKDFISDGNEATPQESFDVDQTIGNLALISTGEAAVTEYLRDTDYITDTLVYCGDKIARVVQDFKSSAISTNVLKCFEDDIKNGYINLINTDHVNIMNEYSQNNMYSKNTLVYYGNLIARVMKDFIADSTIGNTTQDSFDSDVTVGNLLILNKEAEPGIKPYKQGTFFNKDKLVFADGRIGRVLNDYISDNTASTVEESINIDIANGNLREMAENYKFKLYKTTQDMDKTIDAVNTLPITSIVFENSENISNMQINEAIYGPLGTLALIKEIDINNGIIKAKTVNSREMEFMPPAPSQYQYTIILSGTGFSIGEIVATNTSGVNAEVTAVGANGEILSVKATSASINTNGVGHSIDAEMQYYVGNGKNWYLMPKAEYKSSKEYIQGQHYKKDDLIYFGDILTRAVRDFTSDSALPAISDSFAFDKNSGNILRLTREDIDVPECLGSVKTDTSADLPALAIKGNWVLIENCVSTAPGQAGIGLYNGTSWDISPIPQGTFQFPEPNDDGKLYFRKRETGQSDGEWEQFTKVNGNDITLIVKELGDLTDNTVVPSNGELIWDRDRQILVRGDGITTLGSLTAFYGNSSMTLADILSALGYTPENLASKGQSNGYAPLDSNGLVPTQHLPSALINVYNKTEVDTKDTAVLNAATTLVNTESARANGIETGLRTDIDSHIADTVKHVTQAEKDAWNAKIDQSDLTNYDNHINDVVIHVTQSDKDKWNGMNKAYYVTSVADLPSSGNQIGNIGYVQVSATGVTPIVCDQYLWDGTKWNQLDSNQVSLQFNWGSLQGKPASTPLSIDNTVTVAHNHTNKTVLDKIGQSASGNFTYDGIEIGVKVVFLINENLLPTTGEDSTLYVIYEDSRVRNYPSISIWRDGSYQILGRGTQDSAPVVGDMNILQSEYFSVVKGSKYNITVTPNQYFAFMPVEILKEIEGLKDQEKIIVNVNDPNMFDYNEDLLNITASSKLTISIKEKETELDTVSDFYYSHIDVDLSDYKDIDNIG